MPIFIAPLLLGAAGGGFAGFVVGDGTKGIGNIIKWGVVGGLAYVGAKHFKVIK